MLPKRHTRVSLMKQGVDSLRRKTARMFLVQSVADAHALWQSASNLDSIVIALTPTAMSALERHGLAYEIPETYCSRETIYELGISNYDRAHRIARHVDDVLDQVAPAAPCAAVRPGQCSLQAIKNFLDVVSIRVHELHQMVRALSPKEVVSWRNAPTPLLSDGSARAWTYATYGAILDRISFGVRYRLEGNRLPPMRRPRRSAWHEWIASSPVLFGALSVWRWHRFGLETFLRTLSIQPRAHVLLVGDGYHWFACAKALASAGYSFLRVPELHRSWLDAGAQHLPEATVQSCLEVLESRAEFLQLFQLTELNLYPAFRPWLHLLLERTVGACWEAGRWVSAIVERRNVTAALTTSTTAPTGVALVAMCRHLGLPVLGWQHGAAGHCYNPSLQYSEFENVDTYLVLGPGVKSCYADDAARTGTTIQVIGSRLGRRDRRTVMPRRTKGRRRILYATTNYYEELLYVSHAPAFSDRLFLRTQRAIVDSLGRGCSRDDEVIVKLHPNLRYAAPPLEEFVEAARYRMKFVRAERTFLDLVQESDVTIIDWPQTSLLEALTTDTELFVYAGHLRLLPQAEALLATRAYVARDLDTFIKLIDNYLKDQPLASIDRMDRGFLDEYAKPDDLSRIEAAVVQLVSAANQIRKTR